MTDLDIEKMLSQLPEQAFAKSWTFHNAVMHWLFSNGWKPEREVKVADRGDGRRGFVDVVVDGLGLELDQGQPRKKSIFKLKQLPLGGYVISRNHKKFMRVI